VLDHITLFLLSLSEFSLGHTVPFGASEDYYGRRVCLFSHYDRDSILDDHVLFYLRALSAAGLDIVLISSCPSLEPKSMAAARSLCSTIVFRENRGFDFAGWALAIRTLRGILNAQEIVFANDSVYGPLRPLQPIFDRMSGPDCDFWGVTENGQVARHLQSYFLVFKRKAISHPAFVDFWHGVRALRNKWQLIKAYEVGMTTRLSAQGLRPASLVDFVDEAKPMNPTMDHWRATIEMGSPFLKVQLLRDKPVGTDIDGWKEDVSSLGYDTRLIERHMFRMSQDAPPPKAAETYFPREAYLRERAGAIWPPED
jgi:lipopolysaccharide biosynthesis protein